MLDNTDTFTVEVEVFRISRGTPLGTLYLKTFENINENASLQKLIDKTAFKLAIDGKITLTSTEDINKADYGISAKFSEASSEDTETAWFKRIYGLVDNA